MNRKFIAALVEFDRRDRCEDCMMISWCRQNDYVCTFLESAEQAWEWIQANEGEQCQTSLNV